MPLQGNPVGDNLAQVRNFSTAKKKRDTDKEEDVEEHDDDDKDAEE